MALEFNWLRDEGLWMLNEVRLTFFVPVFASQMASHHLF